MKNFKNLTLGLAFSLGLFVVSCDKDTALVEEEQTAAVGIPQDVLEKANSLHFNTFDMQETMLEKPGGKLEPAYLLEGDIIMTRDQLMNMDLGGDITSKQYRTNNLVSSPRVITIIGYTANNSNGLTSKMQTGLRWAVDNYNALNLSISFQLTFGTDWQTKDMVVYQVSGGAGGSAGFPSGGNPYQFVQINSGLAPYSNNVHEHVIGHEIGHSIGFRHSDYFSRQSCGQNSNEGTAGVGAIHIPGTPTGWDPTSLMNACFGSNEDGEFSSTDVTALNYLY